MGTTVLVDADTLVRQSLHIPRREARRWRHVPIDQEDLESEGRVGLVKAALRFDPRRGVPFSAFALMFVRGAILDVIRERARRRTDRDGGFFDVISLDELDEEGNVRREAVDVGPSPHELVEIRDRIRLIHDLPDRERYALLRTEVDGATAEEVGEELGVSAGRVYMLTSRGAIRLRKRAA